MPPSKAIAFFMANAGYSYDPKTQTPMAGRLHCAQMLEFNEIRAREAGCSFHWEIDPHIDSGEFSNTRPYYRLWTCIARDGKGKVFASLCGIDFGRNGLPWGNSYRRVVEAELACELPMEDD